MSFQMSDEEIKRLTQIGAVMDSIGICTVELAEKLKEHVECCPGGKRCIMELINAEKK